MFDCMPARTGTAHVVTTTRKYKDKVYRTHLLRRSYREGNTVTPFYDPLLAKLCVWGGDREQALEKARAAVADFQIEGPKTNLPFFAELLADERFVSGDYDTGLIDQMRAT